MEQRSPQFKPEQQNTAEKNTHHVLRKVCESWRRAINVWRDGWTDIGQEVDGSWTPAKERRRSVRNRLPLVDASFNVRPTVTEYVVCDGCDV